MTKEQREDFLPVVKLFTSILEKGNADSDDAKKLLGQIRELNKLIPENMRANIEQITGLATSNFGGFISKKTPPTPVTRTESLSGKYHNLFDLVFVEFRSLFQQKCHSAHFILHEL